MNTLENLALNSNDGFANSFSTDLAAGIYEIGIIDNTQGGDPGFTINLDTPVSGPSPVPEPATIALLGMSLAGFGMIRFLRSLRA